jgi:transcription elongation GreA/GreB family factor
MHFMSNLWTRFNTQAKTEAEALTLIEDAAQATDLPSARAIEDQLPPKNVPVGLTFLHARALSAEGQEDAARAALSSLIERLNQAGWLKAMTRVLTDLLPQSPAEAAPLLARARQLGGADAVPDELLFEAHRLHPRHGLLTWLAALARSEAGQTASALRLAGHALPELVAEKNYETAELAMLLLAESDGNVPLSEITRALELLARQEAWDVFRNALGLLGNRLAEPLGALEAWPVLREVWRKHPERTELRPVATRILRGYLVARYPEPEALVALSEIERPSQPADVVLDRLDKGERFPPGYYARHSGWGLGLIRENDTQAVVIDFPSKPLHRMSLATAQQALQPMAPDDLRVLLVRDPAELKRLAGDDPVTLVLKVLAVHKGGRATGDDIRKQLVPSVLTAAAWPNWWKTTRAKLDADRRVDARQAYANTWSVAEPSNEEERAPVPPWQPTKDAFKNLALLDTFLSQHPGEARDVLEAHGDRIGALASGRAPSTEQAAAAGLWLLRAGATPSVLPETLVRSDFDMNALLRRDQEELLPRLTTPDAMAAALNSRLVSVRRAARSKLRELGLEAKVYRDILTRALESPEGALEVLETPDGEISGGSGWSYVSTLAVLDLLEKPPREAHRKRAQALIDPASPLGSLLRRVPLDEDEQTSIASRLTRWQSSDRYRFPVLDFMREMGHAAVVDRVLGARARAVAKVSDRMGVEDEGYDQMLLLTRPTLERLESERQKIGLELKTTIPQAIQKARELGDLRENAEYAAAKAKQAVYAKRFEELEGLQNRARLIEDLKREPGVASPGTEVTLEAADGSELRTFWILGEGDQELGASVVSYLAAVGKALVGRRTGDTVELPQEGEPIICRVVSVEERLP